MSAELLNTYVGSGLAVVSSLGAFLHALISPTGPV